MVRKLLLAIILAITTSIVNAASLIFPPSKAGVKGFHSLVDQLGGKVTYQIGKRSSVAGFLLNDADETINLAGVRGSFHDPYEFAKVLYNRSLLLWINSRFPAKSEASFLLHLLPNLTFGRAMDVQLAVTAIYVDAEGREYSDTVYNDTVAIVYGNDGIDFELIKTYFILLGIAAAFVYFVGTNIMSYIAPGQEAVKVQVLLKAGKFYSKREIRHCIITHTFILHHHTIEAR